MAYIKYKNVNIMSANNCINKINSYEIQSWVVGIVALVLTIFLAISENKTWKDYALIASGWIAATMFCVLLRRVSKISEENHIAVGECNGKISILEEKIRLLNEELKRSAEVAHVLSTLVKPESAMPRSVVSSSIEVQNPEW